MWFLIEHNHWAPTINLHSHTHKHWFDAVYLLFLNKILCAVNKTWNVQQCPAEQQHDTIIQRLLPLIKWQQIVRNVKVNGRRALVTFSYSVCCIVDNIRLCVYVKCESIKKKCYQPYLFIQTHIHHKTILYKHIDRHFLFVFYIAHH